ncbi:MAG TPA: glycosyltransferase [Oscillatoriaceae cyanobacterium]
MRILHVITSINRGGAENHLVELVRGQRAGGHQVAVAYLKGDGYWHGLLESLGCEVKALGLRFYGDLRPLVVLRLLIKSFAPEVLHAHMPPAELYTALARQGLVSTPMVISKHNDEPFYRGPGERWLTEWVARQASSVVAISGAVNRYFAGAYRTVAPKLRTIHYGIEAQAFAQVDTAAVAALRAEWGVTSHEVLIGTVARLAPHKALHVLIDGFARFLRDGGAEARLVLVGRGPLEASLRELCERHRLGDRVVFAGYREDVPTCMHAFDVFALSSIYEGFGLVLIEAMAAGKPVIATAVSAIPEIVVPDETGVLVPSADDQAFAQAIAKLSDAAMRERLGRKGRQRVMEHFDQGPMVERTLSLYQELTMIVPIADQEARHDAIANLGEVK